MKKKMLFILLLSFFSFFCLSTVTFAEKEGTTAGTFSVTPVYPENQVGGENGLFNLLVKPGEKEELAIKVKNYTDKELKVKISLNHATTSDSGALDYSKNNNKLNKSLPFNITEIGKVEKEELIIQPLKEEIVKVNLTIPDKSFEGQVLGGIFVAEDTPLSKEEKEKTVVNRFSYSVPINLYEEKKSIDPKMSLKSVGAVSNNSRPYITAKFSNDTPTIIDNLIVKGEIVDKKSNEKVYTKNEQDLQMAPNSLFNFNFDLQNSEVVAGTYIAKFNVTANGKSFDFEQEFKIENSEANSINEQNAFLEPSKKINLWQIFIIIVLLILIVFLIYKYIKVNKKKNSNRNKKNKSNSTNRKIKSNNTSKKAKGNNTNKKTKGNNTNKKN